MDRCFGDLTSRPCLCLRPPMDSDPPARFAAAPLTLASREGWSVVQHGELRWMVSQEAMALDQTRVRLVDGRVDRGELRAWAHQVMALLVHVTKAERVGGLEAVGGSFRWW